MKTVGAIVIIVTSYILGHARRGIMLLGAEIVDQFVQLFKELRSAIAHGMGSLTALLETCAYKESYNKLTFLAMISSNPKAADNLCDALCDAFEDWESRNSLTKDEAAVISGLLQNIGESGAQNELAKLDFAIERLEQALQGRCTLNEKRKGFYETVFTLTGAALAILLI